MFEVGNIITGYDNNGYSITTEGVLMLVIGTDGEDMDVVILACTKKRGNYVSGEFTVENDTLRFEYTTVGSFMENYTPEYIMSLEDMNRLFEKYPNPNVESVEIESEFEPYVLSDEMRQELISEMKELLIKYHYDNVTEEGLNVILDEWCKNKGYLIRLFEKHPNYNGKFQIAFDYDYSRTIDPVAMRKFANWLNNDEVCELYQEEIKVGDFTYGELYWQFDMYGQIKEAFGCHPKIVTINGHSKEYYTTKRNETRETIKDLYENNNDIRTVGTHAYNREKYKIKERVDRLSSIIYDLSYDRKLSQTVSDKVASIFDAYFPDAKVRRGQKLSRVVHKICQSLGIDVLKTYNKEFAKFADAINPIKVKRHTVISVHPVDYYTMSFGNSWSSCHTIDRQNDRAIDTSNSYHGAWSAGTESYMLDESSCVFYTVNEEYNGDKLELENKVTRCMFHYGDECLIQGRVYPKSNDTGSENLYKDIRDIVQKVFADMLEVPNLWGKNEKGTGPCVRAVESTGCHYRDYEHFDTCNLSTLKSDRVSYKKIKIGHNPICPGCGVVHRNKACILCGDCED